MSLPLPLNAFRYVALVALVLAVSPATPCAAQASGTRARPRIGVALGGGSARAIAHVGVLRWLEEHRIPIDVIGGTSLGGFIGGSFATGMSGDELARLLTNTDWDGFFGRSGFQLKNIRRKTDARDYPGRFEFGLKRGLVAPSAANDGHLIDLLLARLFAPYYDIDDFDALPTPFRTVAVDLRSGELVVLDRGWIADALRATMALPGTLPPVESSGRLLVDGGALNNLPADIIRSTGADVVIAVSAGRLKPTEGIDESALGLIYRTVDTMIRARTRETVAGATIFIELPVDDFAILDWPRTAELIDAGYQATAARRSELLQYAVDDAEWQAWNAARAARRRTALPTPARLVLEGFADADAERMRSALHRHLGHPVAVPDLERDLAGFSSLDRYQTITWQFTRAGAPAARGVRGGVGDNGEAALRVVARPKSFAPPFLMLGIDLENTAGDNFLFTAAARYLTFDVLGSGSELRIDARAGSARALTLDLYRPLAGQWFTALNAGVTARSSYVIDADAVIAQYGRMRAAGGIDFGMNFGPVSELRGGVSIGRFDSSVTFGDPLIASDAGREIRGH